MFLLASIVQLPMVAKELHMEGFILHRWMDRWNEGIDQLLQWIKDGKIKYRETVTSGFENTPKAFIEMIKGNSTGKALVKV